MADAAQRTADNFRVESARQHARHHGVHTPLMPSWLSSSGPDVTDGLTSDAGSSRQR